MLYHIVKPKSDTSFGTYINHVMDAYWPENDYSDKKYKQLVPLEQVLLSEKKIETITTILNEITTRIYNEGTYLFTPSNDGKRSRRIPFPFTDRFYKYFLRRANQSRKDYDDLIRMYKENEHNYSINYRNYNHFINVVAAMARLIMYFQDYRRVENLFLDIPTRQEVAGPDLLQSLCKLMSYKNIPNIRSFKLMLAAFYHDLGKTIVDHRHGMEGATIMADHTTLSLYQLNAIVKKYSDEFELERDDISFIADILSNHDQFGTLHTGESGYLQLVDLVNRVKRYSLKYVSYLTSDRDRALEKQADYSYQSLFDLWVTNVADIIVAIDRKWDLQDDNWRSEKMAIDWIQDFLRSNTGSHLIHDLRIALKMLMKYNLETHTDDTSELARMAQEQSNHHAVERITRLIVESLRTPLEKHNNQVNNQIGELEKEISRRDIKLGKDAKGNIDNQVTRLAEVRDIIEDINRLSVGYWNMSIVRNIKSVSDLQEFCDRLSWIGCMDYSLGFFRTIADRALTMIDEEIRYGTHKTGWIRSKNANPLGEGKEAIKYLEKANAQFFADNYAATVIRIMGHLLFREQYIDRLRNMEFEDAQERLVDEKIDKIIGLEGPHRSNRAIQLILQTIFLY